MSSTSYYLCCVLPIVLGLALISYGFGLFVGWLFWGHYSARADVTERQNRDLRHQIRRLTA